MRSKNTSISMIQTRAISFIREFSFLLPKCPANCPGFAGQAIPVLRMGDGVWGEGIAIITTAMSAENKPKYFVQFCFCFKRVQHVLNHLTMDGHIISKQIYEVGKSVRYDALSLMLHFFT